MESLAVTVKFEKMISTVVVALFCISSKVVLAGGPSSFGVIQEFNFELDLPTSIDPSANQIVKEAEDEVKLPEPSASISARLIPLKIAASSTPKPDGRIKCCQISNGTIGYSSDERDCGKCDRRNEFIFVDSLKSDQLCCMKNNGISKPDECVYSILGRPDPNEVDPKVIYLNNLRYQAF